MVSTGFGECHYTFTCLCIFPVWVGSFGGCSMFSIFCFSLICLKYISESDQVNYIHQSTLVQCVILFFKYSTTIVKKGKKTS